MAYVVTDRCIACRYTDCVSVCPTDCFRIGPTMLVIAPDDCIDCGVCVPECPVKAIEHESARQAGAWPELNRRYAVQWPVQTERIDPLPGAEACAGLADKYPSMFRA